MYNVVCIKKHKVPQTMFLSSQSSINIVGSCKPSYFVETEDHISQIYWDNCNRHWRVYPRLKNNHPPLDWWSFYEPCSPLDLLITLNVVTTDIPLIVEFSTWVVDNENILTCELERSKKVVKALYIKE